MNRYVVVSVVHSFHIDPLQKKRITMLNTIRTTSEIITTSVYLIGSTDKTLLLSPHKVTIAKIEDSAIMTNPITMPVNCFLSSLLFPMIFKTIS